ncbi:MAG TPA: hypothetical protein DEH78_28680 [Solibacterales bacterium]|nr:hypothetical protein [Bryobacterales bacterium]
MRILCTTGWLLLAATACAQQRLAFQDDLWREFDLYRDRLTQLAKAIPQEKYDWRPEPKARSVGEVLLHVSLNNYGLLEMMGRPAPADLFPSLPSNDAAERSRAVFRRGLAMEKEIAGKEKILAAMERAWRDAAAPFRETSAEGLNAPALFGTRKTTVGGLQLRAVAHLHEHLGQLIAYARSIGVKPPWSQE